MKQILQNYKTGKLEVKNLPEPVLTSSGIMVKTRNSLISAGTERTKIETAQMSLVEKAISRLDLVKILVNNIKQEGLLFTLKKAFNKIDTPVTLGYSCSGEVAAVGDDVREFNIGEKVAAVGESFAAHSELNSVPADYAVKIPTAVSFEDAAYVGLGAIALNSIQVAQLKEKEKLVVVGLGLLGQLVVQIARALGCEVFGVDIDDGKIELAKKLGLNYAANPLKDNVEASVSGFTDKKLADCVIITAASKNNMPIELAGKISKNKGRVILVGAMPIEIPRKDYYEKELIFLIARGFGAGLYFKEDKDAWYPFNYKPFTVKENMARFLDLLASKKVLVKPLTTHTYKLTDAEKAYSLIKQNKEKYVGILFEYGEERKIPRVEVARNGTAGSPITAFGDDGRGGEQRDEGRSGEQRDDGRGGEQRDDGRGGGLGCDRHHKTEKKDMPKERLDKKLKIGFIGAGSFAQGYLIPPLKKNRNAFLQTVVTSKGLTAENAAKKHGFSAFSSNIDDVLNNKDIDVVFITTRHNLHAELVVKSINSSKHVFVEKPLCINKDEFFRIEEAYKGRNVSLMVGFNRRFSPLGMKAKEHFKNKCGPFNIIYRINAGFLPAGHWVYSEEGGGRITGEVCHFIDFIKYICGTRISDISAVQCGDGAKYSASDNIVVNLKFVDGSLGVICYNSAGDPGYSRERIEIFNSGSVAVIDNFQLLEIVSNGIIAKKSLFARDMGHNNEMKLYSENMANNFGSLIPYDDIIEVTKATLLIKDAVISGRSLKIEDFK